MKSWFRRMQEGGYYTMKKREEEERLRRKWGQGPPLFEPQTLSPKITFTPVSKATIERVWVDFDVQQNNRHGMAIHTAFTYTKPFLSGDKGQVTVHFGPASGGMLKDLNGAYHDRAGNVCVWRDFTSIPSSFTFPDYILFMPYDELHLLPGHHDLRLWVTIWRSGRKRLAASASMGFTVDNPT